MEKHFEKKWFLVVLPILKLYQKIILHHPHEKAIVVNRCYRIVMDEVAIDHQFVAGGVTTYHHLGGKLSK